MSWFKPEHSSTKYSMMKIDHSLKLFLADYGFCVQYFRCRHSRTNVSNKRLEIWLFLDIALFSRTPFDLCCQLPSVEHFDSREIRKSCLAKFKSVRLMGRVYPLPHYKFSSHSAINRRSTPILHTFFFVSICIVIVVIFYTYKSHSWLAKHSHG